MGDILLGIAIVLIITLGCGAFGLCFGYITHIEDVEDK